MFAKPELVFMQRRNLIVAITGATGTIFGVRILQLLQGTDVNTHLVISRWGAHTLAEETDYSRLTTYGYVGIVVITLALVGLGYYFYQRG